MKPREIVCKFYEAETHCQLGKEGTFRSYCQRCKYYEKRPRTLPARIDRRKQKLEKINKKELRRGEW